MQISIAMATYNGEKYLQEQLDSLLGQTLQPDELIVCDDGSKDATLSILNTFSAISPFKVSIYQNELNLGYAKNFEQAISLCTGDVVFLCDQDDVWFSNKIETVMQKYSENQDILVVVNNAELVDENLVRTALTVSDQLITAGLSTDDLLLGCVMSFKTEIRELLVPVPSEIHGHDGWLNTISNLLHVRLFIPDVLQVYRRHGKNTSESLTTRTKLATKLGHFREKIRWENLRAEPELASMSRLNHLNILLERIESRKPVVQLLLPSSVNYDELHSKLIEDIQLNVKRFDIQKKSLPIRLFYCMKFYLSGHYQRFEGIHSFIRDVIG